jgi:uncharacterized protein
VAPFHVTDLLEYHSQQPQESAMTHQTTPRRADRQVTDDAWIHRFLHHAAAGALALSVDDQPYLHTNLFVYDEDNACIYLHTARAGRLVESIAANPRVSFSVHEMGRLLPAEQALEFSVEYAGVVVFGQAALVADEVEATRALQALLDKYAPHLAPGRDYRPPVAEELKRTAVFRLAIEAWSGKKKEVGEFAGAFWYDETPTLASGAARQQPLP